MTSLLPTTNKRSRATALPAIRGLELHEGFISAKEEAELIAFLRKQAWSSATSTSSSSSSSSTTTAAARRVQQYGFRYHYSGSSAEPEPTTPIPSAFRAVINRLVERKVFPRPPTQIIVNEYQPGQGIAPHTDNTKHFGPVVASLSLGSVYPMTFDHKQQSHDVWLSRGSMLVLKDDARYDCLHSIAKRKTDTRQGVKLPRGTRISLTFRTMTRDEDEVRKLRDDDQKQEQIDGKRESEEAATSVEDRVCKKAKLADSQ